MGPLGDLTEGRRRKQQADSREDQQQRDAIQRLERYRQASEAG
jgi:hypothetical protein